MTPPRICPPPPDCPLYEQRLAYGADEPLRRAVLSERPRRSLGSLVWEDFNRQHKRPEAPPTRPSLPPSPDPVTLPSFGTVKGADR